MEKIMTETKKPNIEIEICDSTGKHKSMFVFIDETEKIWFEVDGLPNTVFLCASIDCTPMISAKVGDISLDESRVFVGIDWLIEEWGGDTSLVASFKKRKQMTLDDLPRLKKEYWGE